jgi:hypothetical protein
MKGNRLQDASLSGDSSNQRLQHFFLRKHFSSFTLASSEQAGSLRSDEAPSQIILKHCMDGT